ncbi:MAG TPA: VWA domain-containing protein [Streptosporangiaceae bacterium]|jgi:hypothetical protein
MSDGPDFSVRIDQNRYLPEGGQDVHAIVTVTAEGSEPNSGPGRITAEGPAAGPDAAEVIIIDTSGSMTGPGDKIGAAKRAAQAAIDTLRDGVNFAIIAGANTARMVYPNMRRLVPVTDRSRAEAKAAVRLLTPDGGTAIGQWLRLADAMLGQHPQAIRHAILLTDGKNQHERPEVLDATLGACAGHFVCDCRGVGTDWSVPELRKVASALLGSVDLIANPDDLEADFRAMAQTSMGKAVADVALRVWIPQGARLRFVKQVLPTVEDLTGKRTDSGPQSGDYPTGAWGDETRDYHICVEVPPGDVGREMRAAWVKVVASGPAGEEVRASGNVLAEWTADEAMSTQINPHVAQYTGQEELAEAIQEGLAARRDGDVDTATTRLGRAVALAHETGNEGTARLLSRVVDVIDVESGTVRLKPKVAQADEMSLDTRSTRTVRTRGRAEPAGSGPDAPPQAGPPGSPAGGR